MKKRRLSQKRKNNSKVHILHYTVSRHYVIIASVFILFIAAANIQITHTLSATTQPSVLGEGEEKKEVKKEEKKEENKGSENRQEEQKKTEERQKEEQKKQEEQRKIESVETTNQNTSRNSGSSKETIKTKTETVSSEGLKMQTETEGNKQETEIETAQGKKIKTKKEDDGATKIEVENGSMKLKYKVENGRMVLKAENGQGDEVELPEDEVNTLKETMETELEDSDVKLNPGTGNTIVVTNKRVTAVTNFPISVDVTTKKLIISTPDGQKTITVLPDQAVKNLLATGIVNTVETSPDNTVGEGQKETPSDTVKLEVRNNEVVYRVNGLRTHKMLGFIPVTTPVTAFVSTETGATIAKQQSLLTNIVDLLSP